MNLKDVSSPELFSDHDGTTRQRFVGHSNDSKVTLNVCLGHNFDSVDLRCNELRGTDREEHIVGAFVPQLGVSSC